MNRSTAGWIAVVIAIGTSLGAIGKDLATLMTWSQAITPVFIGGIFVHLSSSAIAYLAGQVQPTASVLVKNLKDGDK